MSTPKNPDHVKKTLNLREGDFEKMGELFPKMRPSVAIRELISKFIDRHYMINNVPETEEVDL